MFLKIAQSLLLIAFMTTPPLAGARMLASTPGAVDVAPLKGNGLINQIITGKNVMTIDGMDFIYIPGRTKISGAASLRAGQQIEYTAVQEGKLHRITEVRVLPSVEPSKPQ